MSARIDVRKSGLVRTLMGKLNVGKEFDLLLMAGVQPVISIDEIIDYPDVYKGVVASGALMTVFTVPEGEDWILYTLYGVITGGDTTIDEVWVMTPKEQSMPIAEESAGVAVVFHFKLERISSGTQVKVARAAGTTGTLTAYIHVLVIRK